MFFSAVGAIEPCARMCCMNELLFPGMSTCFGIAGRSATRDLSRAVNGKREVPGHALMVHWNRPFLVLFFGPTSGHPSRSPRHTHESQTRFVSRIGNVSSATDQLSPIGPKHE